MRSPILPALLFSLWLAGCATTPRSPTAITIEDAKTAIAASRSAWKDPDSIRDSRIGQPYSAGCWGAAEHLVSPPDSCVCIATNAKNSFGGYGGLKTQVALIKDRRVIDFIDARMHDQCSGMVSWPEFDGRR